mmetsp:Transcript_4234/g.12167  ORF Transcript_4234/g.12167 Transcript_4234/m.12167 type:complete len:227 (+) Transcript_4234:359-1039(+)
MEHCLHRRERRENTRKKQEKRTKEVARRMVSGGEMTTRKTTMMRTRTRRTTTMSYKIHDAPTRDQLSRHKDPPRRDRPENERTLIMITMTTKLCKIQHLPNRDHTNRPRDPLRRERRENELTLTMTITTWTAMKKNILPKPKQSLDLRTIHPDQLVEVARLLAGMKKAKKIMRTKISKWWTHHRAIADRMLPKNEHRTERSTTRSAKATTMTTMMILFESKKIPFH